MAARTGGEWEGEESAADKGTDNADKGTDDADKGTDYADKGTDNADKGTDYGGREANGKEKSQRRGAQRE
jgi:hypothetical protein